MSYEASAWALQAKCDSGTEKAVLLCLASYVGPDGTCFPSHKTISDASCCSTKSVERALASFEERGWIRRSRRTRRDGSRTSDRFHFIAVKHPERPEDQTDTESVRPQTKQTPCPNLTDTVSGLTTFEPVRREEDIYSEDKSSSYIPAHKKPRASKRAPESWNPSASVIAVGVEEGLSEERIRRELAVFRDYTFSSARSDWDATFRNWLRKAAERKPNRNHADDAVTRAENAKRDQYARIAQTTGFTGEQPF